jgi:hypothetical protein
MSAILSADDLNDFISPGVACIKPIEIISAKPEDGSVGAHHKHPLLEDVLTFVRTRTKSQLKRRRPRRNHRHPHRYRLPTASPVQDA